MNKTLLISRAFFVCEQIFSSTRALHVAQLPGRVFLSRAPVAKNPANMAAESSSMADDLCPGTVPGLRKQSTTEDPDEDDNTSTSHESSQDLLIGNCLERWSYDSPAVAWLQQNVSYRAFHVFFFVVVGFFGGLLLYLVERPRDAQPFSFTDGIFSAYTSITVTGLTCANGAKLSLGGQLIMFFFGSHWWNCDLVYCAPRFAAISIPPDLRSARRPDSSFPRRQPDPRACPRSCGVPSTWTDDQNQTLFHLWL